MGGPTPTSRARRRVDVRGVVQGVGFRPHVYSLAHRLGLTGTVWNSSRGVHAEVEGRSVDIDAFCARVGPEAPPLAHVASVSWSEERPRGGTGFTISESESTPGRTFVAPDVTVCDDCIADLADPTNRRYRHPFVTCTNCGPRFTIVTGVPYDRPATTMAGFPLCSDCAREYADPADRRFHAQPISCPACGPRLRLVGPGLDGAEGEDAMALARALLGDGAVIAVKGVGGYHLSCDATNDDAVSTLRKRKQRGDKPFAVMVRDVVAARRIVGLTEQEVATLEGHARPVVLARRVGNVVSAEVAPGNGDLGVMLGYTPLHQLLLGLADDVAGPEVLVMTSGNVAGEPIVTDDVEALTRLSGLADAWLTHDREIHVPCDDSVVRVVDEVELPVRRSRGFAPLPLTLPFDSAPALAVGADLKNTFAVAEGRLAWLSAHVGDMDDLATLTAFDAAERHLEQLTDVTPAVLVADRHPAYRSRRWAVEHADGRPVIEVQHHHAHVAATMAEHGLGHDERVLGMAFDGTGYGPDGAAWGGEVLVASYSSFIRAAHLAYVDLPGGDAGVRNPCRMALSHLRAAGVEWGRRIPSVQACRDHELSLLERQLTTRTACVPTSSMGRLFDAVASLAGVCHRSGYDAQAAMELEARARRSPVGDGGYRFALVERDGTWVADAAPVVHGVVDDVLAGVEAGVVAARFHDAVVALVVATADRLRDEHDLRAVTLSGGVFLNALLTSGCARALSARGFEVLRHRKVPPSDAGIALGQLAILAHTPLPRVPTGGPDRRNRSPHVSRSPR